MYGKQRMQMPKRGEYVEFKIFERKKITIRDLCRFCKHFSARSYLGKDAAYFFNEMIEQNKYCSEVIKKTF